MFLLIKGMFGLIYLSLYVRQGLGRAYGNKCCLDKQRK